MIYSAQRAANRFAKEELQDRWLSLCKRLGVKGDVIYHVKLYDQLTHYYSHPARVYHNLEHIRYCLGKFDEVIHLVPHPDLVELAIWFHDAIYELWADDDEFRSASLALFFITQLMGLERDLARRVAFIIENTAYFNKNNTHTPNEDAKYMIDIDLAGFGDTLEVFEQNGKNVAAEYGWVDTAEHLEKRIKILKIFRTRDPFYLTDYFRKKYQERARDNLDIEINILEHNKLEQLLKTAN